MVTLRLLIMLIGLMMALPGTADGLPAGNEEVEPQGLSVEANKTEISLSSNSRSASITITMTGLEGDRGDVGQGR